MKKLTILTLFTIGVFSCTGQQHDVVAVADFDKKIKENTDVVIIDVRTTEEMNNGFISGAIQMDFHDPMFNESLQKLDKSKTYMIYCRSGGRSGRTGSLMKELGFQNVYDLDGGINAWNADSMPLDKP